MSGVTRGVDAGAGGVSPALSFCLRKSLEQGKGPFCGGHGAGLGSMTAAERALALLQAFAQTEAQRRRDTSRTGVHSPGNTTHVSVVDAAGMAVSVTSSSGSGSGIVVPGTGIMLNNMMGEEDLKPDGFFALPPGERLTSMMAPTIACSGDRPWAEPSQQASGEVISLGSAGSERLRSAIVQVLVNMLDMGMDPQAAVDQPRLHLERGVVHLEPDHVEAVAACLEEEGYPVNRWPSPDLYFGGTQVAQGRYEHGRTEFKGGGDPRRGGASLCL